MRVRIPILLLLCWLLLTAATIRSTEDRHLFAWKGSRAADGAMILEPMMPVRISVLPTGTPDLPEKKNYSCTSTMSPLVYKDGTKSASANQLTLVCDGDARFVVLGIQFQ